MEEVDDEPLHFERVAALDIAKATLEACIRVPSKANRHGGPRKCAASAPPKRRSCRWPLGCVAWDVAKVVMEATSDYWKAPFFRLEAEGFDCELLDAKQVKALPGRPKTDRADCIWLAKVAERGMVAGCFVPPEEIRQLRTLTRYRRHLTEERSREKQRAEKLLEDALVKLSVVVSDLHGVSSRADHGGAHRRLPGPQRPSPSWPGAGCGSKTRALEEALDGADTFSDHHGFVLRMMLDNIDRLSAQIDKLTAQVEQLIAPFERQVAQLDGITGVGRTAAQDLIAEIGVDMAAFATPAHLVSWAKFCPQVKESAGKRKGRNSRGKGNRYVAGVLGEASVAAGRTQTRLGARYRRLAKRRGKAKAQVALGNTILTIAHALLSDPTAEYHDLGADYYEAHAHHRRQVNSHLRALQRLGYTVTLAPPEAAA